MILFSVRSLLAPIPITETIDLWIWKWHESLLYSYSLAWTTDKPSPYPMPISTTNTCHSQITQYLCPYTPTAICTWTQTMIPWQPPLPWPNECASHLPTLPATTTTFATTRRLDHIPAASHLNPFATSIHHCHISTPNWLDIPPAQPTCLAHLTHSSTGSTTNWILDAYWSSNARWEGFVWIYIYFICQYCLDYMIYNPIFFYQIVVQKGSNLLWTFQTQFIRF